MMHAKNYYQMPRNEIRNNWLGHSTVEKGSGILMDRNCNRSQQCSFKK